MPKRFNVLCGGGNKISIREMPGEVQLTHDWPEDGEKKLVRMVAKYFSCEAKAVMRWGTLVEIETSLPDDYELCGVCGLDHAYDGSTPEGKRQMDERHEEAR